MSKVLSVLSLVIAIGALLSIPVLGEDSPKNWVDRERIQLTDLESDEGAKAYCPIDVPQGAESKGRLRVSIWELGGKELASQEQTIPLKAGARKYMVPLSGSVPKDQLAKCFVRYELKAGSHTEKGGKALIDAASHIETRLVAYRDLTAGSKASVRLVVLDHASGEGVPDAKVNISLHTKDPDKGKEIFSGETNSKGTLEAGFSVPKDIQGEAKLKIDVTTKDLGSDSIEQPVTVQRKSKILLTTDKPLYQPGQIIHIRALCLQSSDLNPEGKKELIFEVMDSKGNKVFKKKMDTNDYGIASVDFQLATELNVGSYIVRAILENTQSEKQVTIDRYVLPKFKVVLKSEKDFYLPGEKLKGEIQADYFFGKPVAQGKITLSASKFEIEFTEFSKSEGTLDDNGHWDFEIALPTYFAGTPLEQGKASVKLEAKIVDTADHREEKVIMVPVAQSPLTINAVPESGSLIPNLENQVYILVNHPDGTPAEDATIKVTTQGGKLIKADSQVDSIGIGTAYVSATPNEQVSLTIEAQGKDGQKASKMIQLSTQSVDAGLILRTDKALYKVGESIKTEAFATKAKGTVYFDMIRDGQTVMTKTADLAGGKASMTMEVDASMFGSVALQAYVFTSTTDLLRDTKLLYINPADDLQLNIALDKETYKPGEKATVQFHLNTRNGKKTPGALGVSIVDESVFALQEIHPGLEKIYFTLEKEIMKPRYEIHGFEMDKIVLKPGPIVPLGGVEDRKKSSIEWTDQQQEAARVLLASAAPVRQPPINVNTFTAKREAAEEAIQKEFNADWEHIQNVVQRYLQKKNWKAPDNLLDALLREKLLRENELLDPWGTPYNFDFSQVEQSQGYFTMTSSGPDGIKGNSDDLDMQQSRMKGDRFVRGERNLNFFALGAVEERAMPAAAAPMRMEAKAAAKSSVEVADNLWAAYGVAGAAAPVPPRLREYFPETLLFEPSLITDENGEAKLEIEMADSITTWRMTAMASSKSGTLGSKDQPMRVFQDFFVDLDLPVTLTKNDRVSIPVVLYNYLKAPQKVRLKFEKEPWFALDGEAEQTLDLASEEVRSLYYPIQVKELGKHKLTVWAYGEQMSDAIRREIEVVPDGEENNVSFSDRLSKDVEQTVTIPESAIDGASKILVRVFPGVYSQIVDGLDSMLQMPFGCFEQTSSVTYPNILVVQYMKATKQINPEIQMKAEGFINAGYQRLLTYEVAGGGYSWFGDAPANKVLTAWGLKEFHDMSQIHEVDPSVIERTRTWLLSKQEGNGSWKADENFLHAESWGAIQKNDLLVTSYIADSILGTGEKGEKIQKAIDYLKGNWKDTQEPYVLALLANALVSWNAKDPWTSEVLDRLHGLRQDDKDVTCWKSGTETVTYSHGDCSDIETTALAAIAFMNAGKYPETTSKALTYLIRKKSAQGHWGSTQATILALKALMVSLGSRTEKVDAVITVNLDGNQVSEIKVTPEDSDVMRLVDLGDKTKKGNNVLKLSLKGEGSMLYQIVGRFYLPWQQKAPQQEAMSISVAYDKKELAVNDLVTATVKATNNRPKEAKMIIIDLGIPPGFQVVTTDLDELVTKKTFSKYELTGRQIITYFEKLDANQTVEFSYKLRAKFPLRVKTPESKVYEYYNPEVSNTAAPQEMEVK